MDAHSLALERVPVFVEHYSPEAIGSGEETFNLDVLGYHEVREIVRGGVWRKEIGSPSWKPLDRFFCPLPGPGHLYPRDSIVASSAYSPPMA